MGAMGRCPGEVYMEDNMDDNDHEWKKEKNPVVVNLLFDEWMDEESVDGLESDGVEEGIGRADYKMEQRRPEVSKTKSNGKDL